MFRTVQQFDALTIITQQNSNSVNKHGTTDSRITTVSINMEQQTAGTFYYATTVMILSIKMDVSMVGQSHPCLLVRVVSLDRCLVTHWPLSGTSIMGVCMCESMRARGEEWRQRDS